MHARIVPVAAFLLTLGSRLPAQTQDAADLASNLSRLNIVGSVLMIAAHPDDENTALLAYLSKGRNVRTGYLSLTRGEGGQNLIGSDQGDVLGLIRTHELLAARRIDGAEQFFTRAIDFGFSKTADETLAKWGREPVLSDIVWVIRSFRPDVIVLRFSGTPRDGHGHHQSSAILGKEAFSAAADSARFPEQLKYVRPWQARRLMFNLFSFTPEMEKENEGIPNRITIDTGEYNRLLGMSYGEIAGRSRSMHASQGMGVAQRRGSIRDQLVVIAGESASHDLLEGIDTSWKRLPGGAAIDAILSDAINGFRATSPEKTLPFLAKVRPLVAAIDHPDARRKLVEVDELMARCAGLWVDATAERSPVAPGTSVSLTMNVVRRTKVPVTLTAANLDGMEGSPAVAEVLPYNDPNVHRAVWPVPADATATQPYWLAAPKNGNLYSVADPTLIGRPENPPLKVARFRFRLSDAEITLTRPVQFRYVDSVRGELTRAFLVAPPVVAEVSPGMLLFPAFSAKPVHVSLRANRDGVTGRLRLEVPRGWRVQPDVQDFKIEKTGEQSTYRFQVTPPAADSTAVLRAVIETPGRSDSKTMRIISYPHIPLLTIFPPAEARIVRADIRITTRHIGYIMGAGDEVPDALRELGVEVTLLTDDDLATADLSRFDAVVTGVRAFNTRPALRANFQRLLDYTAAGGRMIVQYNVDGGGFPGSRDNRDALARLGPYPIKLSRDRVTVEEAPIQFSNPNHPVLTSPNRITQADFQGWVQERGLYYPREYDSHYQSLFASHDPGEDWLPGGMLYTQYGKGVYIYTSYAWFRQLPAGVPGALRIFANLLSAQPAPKR